MRDKICGRVPFSSTWALYLISSIMASGLSRMLVPCRTTKAISSSSYCLIIVNMSWEDERFVFLVKTGSLKRVSASRLIPARSCPARILSSYRTARRLRITLRLIRGENFAGCPSGKIQTALSQILMISSRYSYHAVPGVCPASKGCALVLFPGSVL